ncbi:MAG: adenosylhomocysteinase [Clostridia bacterium]|nr:adenosylhomocysteinase [Clostridia bacterium]
MASVIKDINLKASGIEKIEWVRAHMPILDGIEKRFIEQKPFAGMKIAMSIHMEAKTARAALLFKAGGAEVHATGCNPLSTQDDVAAALSDMGVEVCAVHAASMDEYREHLIMTLSCRPNIIIDDGGDLTQILLDERPDLARELFGGGEETTTGVMRLRARARAGHLTFPMICVNDAKMKYLFDNRYGTGQSVLDGIMRTTNLLIAGSRVVVAGYGWCGKGAAMRLKAMGARVTVCEVDPVKAVEAAMDGFDVATMSEACEYGDIFITLTGCRDVITIEHMRRMKDKAIMCNAGHFDVEVDVAALRANAAASRGARNNIEEFVLPDGKRLYVLAEGRLVNLAAGDGHPSEIMDISFALQALCAEYMAKNHAKLKPGAIEVPAEIDEQVALMKLKSLGMSIDRLTDEQRKYLGLCETGED